MGVSSGQGCQKSLCRQRIVFALRTSGMHDGRTAGEAVVQRCYDFISPLGVEAETTGHDGEKQPHVGIIR